MCFPSPSLSSAVRPVDCTADNYDSMYVNLYELVISICLIILVLIKLASRLIENTRFVTFDTCLDYLPPRFNKSLSTEQILVLIFSHVLPIAYFFLVDLYLIIAFWETLLDFLTILMVRFFVLYLKLYFLMFLNFIYIYELLLPKSRPYLKVVVLWFLKLILLLSSDIETQPGPILNNNCTTVQERGSRNTSSLFATGISIP